MNGEVAIDLIIENSVVKKNGDAWRIAMDSCIPVIKFIDTTRSIPYGIPQIQDLLGISCAFDQSVQVKNHVCMMLLVISNKKMLRLVRLLRYMAFISLCISG